MKIYICNLENNEINNTILIMKKKSLLAYSKPDVKEFKFLASSQLCDSSPEADIDEVEEGSVRGAQGAFYFD